MKILMFSTHSMKYIWYSFQKSKYPIYIYIQYKHRLSRLYNTHNKMNICLYGITSSMVYKIVHTKNKKKNLVVSGGSVVVDFLFIVTPIVGVCNCSMFCCTLLYVQYSIAIILMEKRELVALLYLSS